MGAESDHLIFDYLSRVGDLAQTRLPVDRRMQLVARLRSDIDHARGRSGSDSPAAVRRILRRLGSPDEVVGAAAGVPEQRAEEGQPAPDKEWWRLQEMRGAQPKGPHWPMSPGEELVGLPGMTGGLTVPLEPEKEAEAQEHEDEDEPEEAAEAEDETSAEWAPLRRRLRRRRAPGAAEPQAPVAARRTRVGWVESFAALLLVAGAVPIRGTWPALAAGWLIAYYSPRLTRAQAKFATLTVPGLVAGGALVWLWGRFDGRWGEKIADGQLDAAIVDAFPVVVRVAAVATAVFVVWRSRRAS